MDFGRARVLPPFLRATLSFSERIYPFLGRARDSIFFRAETITAPRSRAYGSATAVLGSLLSVGLLPLPAGLLPLPAGLLPPPARVGSPAWPGLCAWWR